MKSEYHKDGEGIHAVALFARAWIEISNGNILAVALSSSPSLRGRGLKYNGHNLIHADGVALFARAWIEIYLIYTTATGILSVALFARAWIEIAFCCGLSA